MDSPAATDQRSRLIGILALLFGACVIAFAPILVKLSDLGPQALSFWRLFFALPALGIWLAFQRTGNQIQPAKPNYKALILAGIFFAGDLAFWHAGIKITTAANATLLANLTPVIVAIASWWIFKETITYRFMISAALALSGAWLLAAANISIAPERLMGDILSALTAFWYASYLLSVRVARQGASTPYVMLISTLVATPIALVIALIYQENLFPDTLAGWWPLIGLGIVVHTMGQGGIAFGLGRVPAPLASLIILIQPVIAALAGWIIFGEFLVASQFLGAGLVLVGVYLAQRSRQTNT